MRQLRQQRRQTASALSSPQGLLSPINRVPRSKRADELLELVHALHDIEHEEAVLNEVEKQLSEDPNYQTAGQVRAPSRLYARANAILSAFHWSPRVAPPPHESHSFTWNARTAESDWQNRFVFWVLNQHAKGNASLIRTCRNCHKWFYAITNHQLHCSDPCRQHFHSTDKKFKEKRRLYMRRFRKEQRSRNQRQSRYSRLQIAEGESRTSRVSKKGRQGK